MSRIRFRLLGAMAVRVIALGSIVGSAAAYPGGTPDFQTDVAPFCAGCHASTAESDLAGLGERAVRELPLHKHYDAIRSGAGPYAALSEEDRAKLVEQLAAVDRNAMIQLEFPPQVTVGELFSVTVKVMGGSGPVVGVALVDRTHRHFARPATAVGWQLVGAPSIIGTKGPQTSWLARRPERAGREITFVNVLDMQSSAEEDRWSRAKVVFTLKAPLKPGAYPLAGVFLYGTEKATALGTRPDPERGPQPLGGLDGHSGRVKFSDPAMINVKPAEPSATAP